MLPATRSSFSDFPADFLTLGIRGHSFGFFYHSKVLQTHNCPGKYGFFLTVIVSSHYFQ